MTALPAHHCPRRPHSASIPAWPPSPRLPDSTSADTHHTKGNPPYQHTLLLNTPPVSTHPAVSIPSPLYQHTPQYPHTSQY